MSPLIHTPSNPRRVRARLGDGDVHVWSARLDLPSERVVQLERSLTADERERSPHRRLSRAVLRQLLGGYVDVPPEDLVLLGGMDQKPRLPLAPGGEELYFNQSHSGDLLILALARTPHLGVDLERVRSIRRLDTIARRAFSDAERNAISSLPADQRQAAFFNCWTRKEACVKAVGQGVWSAFGRWEVSVAPGEPARVVVADGEAAGAGDWSLVHLEPAPGYVGALAVRGTDWSVEAWTLNPAEDAR